MNDIWRHGICCGGGEEGRTPRRAREPQLEASKQQVFESHAAELPRVALLAIHFRVVLAFGDEGCAVAFPAIVPYYDLAFLIMIWLSCFCPFDLIGLCCDNP
jgi:hypothetical protein